MSLKDRDAVLNIIASPFVLESGVIKFILKPNRTCLDLKRQGMMEIPRKRFRMSAITQLWWPDRQRNFMIY